MTDQPTLPPVNTFVAYVAESHGVGPDEDCIYHDDVDTALMNTVWAIADAFGLDRDEVGRQALAFQQQKDAETVERVRLANEARVAAREDALARGLPKNEAHRIASRAYTIVINGESHRDAS